MAPGGQGYTIGVLPQGHINRNAAGAHLHMCWHHFGLYPAYGEAHGRCSDAAGQLLKHAGGGQGRVRQQQVHQPVDAAIGRRPAKNALEQPAHLLRNFLSCGCKGSSWSVGSVGHQLANKVVGCMSPACPC